MSECACKLRKELELLKGVVSAIMRNILTGKKWSGLEDFFKFSTNIYPPRNVELAKNCKICSSIPDSMEGRKKIKTKPMKCGSPSLLEVLTVYF